MLFWESLAATWIFLALPPHPFRKALYAMFEFKIDLLKSKLGNISARFWMLWKCRPDVSYLNPHYLKLFRSLRIISWLSEQNLGNVCMDEDVEVLSPQGRLQEGLGCAKAEPVFCRCLHVCEPMRWFFKIKTKWLFAWDLKKYTCCRRGWGSKIPPMTDLHSGSITSV